MGSLRDSNTSGATWADMIYDSPIDAARPIRVICIGAGASGICAGVRFPQKIANLSLTIYDKNADVGGTWFANKSVAPTTLKRYSVINSSLDILACAATCQVQVTNSPSRVTLNGLNSTPQVQKSNATYKMLPRSTAYMTIADSAIGSRVQHGWKSGANGRSFSRT